MDNPNDIVGSAISLNNNSSSSIAMKPQTVIIDDKKELYKCYMPFIKGGGLFIPFNDDVTAAKIFPGLHIFIIFSMLDNKKKIPINGKVVWINKTGNFKGYGVAFNDTAPMRALKENIEHNILEFILKKEPTYTI